MGSKPDYFCGTGGPALHRIPAQQADFPKEKGVLWRVWELANDRKEYGDDAGKCIITTEDGETEITGVVIDRETAHEIVTAHNSLIYKDKKDKV